ncbi:hypothetical protein GALL_531960 [mine drainage metagenome]|uniref:Uncharacterized protein n=1 Tax=mine drainage metagenome TaxID=410659 RepID=A0A1J5PBS5_9ZZZZ
MAADDADQALKAFNAALKKKEDTSDLQSTANDAVAKVESERDSLEKDHAGDPAIATYAPVAKAQRAWLDALTLTIDAGDQTKRVRKFIDFVTDKKIEPFTEYARQNWPDKPDEFFSEAYSLFLSDPEFLKKNSAPLYNWFKSGSYK